MSKVYYDNQIVPFTDINMVYDSTIHRYTLTIDAVDNELNANFIEYAGSEENAEALLREISGDFYKYIYKYNRRDINKRKADEHMLAKNGDLRDVIKDSMMDMCRGLIRSGFLLQKDLAWVIPETGTVMDLSNVPDIAPDAIDGLFAYGILHKGPYSYKIEAEDYRSDY